MKVEARDLTTHLNMLLLATLEHGALHGYGVLAALRERSDGRVDLGDGSVYPRLHRLEHLGFIGSSSSTVNGQVVRVYQLTPAGRDQLHADRRAWQEYAALITRLAGTDKERPTTEGPPRPAP